jgi:hypothetical protein
MVDETLVVALLHGKLFAGDVAKVVAQRYQDLILSEERGAVSRACSKPLHPHVVGLEQLGLLFVLVQQHLRPLRQVLPL